MLGLYQISALSGTMNWIRPASEISLYNISVIDGTNPYVSAGLSLTRAKKGDFIHLALSKKIDYWISVGIHAKRFNLRSKDLPPNVESYTVFDGGASVSIAIPKEWSSYPILLALTSDNLHHATGAEKYLGPKEFSFAAKINFKDLLLVYGDFVHATSTYYGGYPMYHSGAEIALGNEFFARGGMFGFRNTGWGLGGGWVGPKLGLNYGYQKQTNESQEKLHTLTLDLYM